MGSSLINTSQTMQKEYKVDTYVQCITQELTENEDFQSGLIAAVPSLRAHLPSLEQLAAFKDTARIADNKWDEFMALLGFSYARVAAMRRQRKLDNGPVKLQRIGDVGYQYELIDYMTQMLKDDPPSDPSKPIILKLAIDGAIMTSHKKISQVIGGIQHLHPGDPLSTAKSPSSCHVITIYIGGETNTELKTAFASISEVCPFSMVETHIG